MIQLARPPYIGLWTRLSDFGRQDLAHLIENRAVVKVTFMRATLHAVLVEEGERLIRFVEAKAKPFEVRTIP